MKRLIRWSIALGCAGLLTSPLPSTAAILVPNPGYAPGIGYEWGITMDQNDWIVFGSTDHPNTPQNAGVGARSWAEPLNPDGLKGWTHTVHWVALDLSGLTETTILDVTMARGTTGELFPAFTLYRGWELTGPESHEFNNIGSTPWASSLEYIGHVQNGGGPNGTDNGKGVASIAAQFILEPGLYSLALGGNPPYDADQSGRQAYSARIKTAPIPLPAAIWLIGGGLVGLAGLARRHHSSAK
ncbi:VPLPA-CTERM sorting domain-containing protein [Candidatus Nitrospira inopinata]|jgi:hypothetical protein|uniref:VPLPA-CTERM sorting domain-containing protein n=1 Tax=Candidatus Nitrospira inopinata TaxID=1715989 RepID=A0A0S4KLV6_9BACT|nr:VPLPA-CTERM sorting domain-containing protein [Candidatus Nitrospira inopinata]CUQ65420.1 exported protein of unknown function [Candidatus Nitrospira inopinata]